MSTMQYTGHHTSRCPVEGCQAVLTVLPYYFRNGAPSDHISTVRLFDPDGRSWWSSCQSYEVRQCAEHFAQLHAETHAA